MAYQRKNRGNDETRPIVAKVGVIKNADGSAYFKIGNTAAYAAVYGPKECHPRHQQNPDTGILRTFYNMMPFSGAGDRVRPGPNRRSKEISKITQNAIKPVVDLSNFPNSAVDVFIELSETDAGSRCAGICAASMALADAGITMKDLVSSVSVGNIGDTIVVDLDGDEEHIEDTNVSDVPITVIPTTGEITHLQMDGKISQDMLKKAVEKARSVCSELNNIQREALLRKFSDNPDAELKPVTVKA